MNRYMPTREERDWLKTQGWRVDYDGWWWPAGGCGYGRTYREALRENASIQHKRRLTFASTADGCADDRLPDTERESGAAATEHHR